MSALVTRAALACASGGLLLALTLAGPARASHCNARIDSEPRGAKVFVSGSLIGTTPLTYVSGSETTVSVRLEKKGFKTWTGRVFIPHDGSTSVMQKLEPVGRDAARH